MLTHFGMSLFTLNNVFQSIQENILDLRSDNFKILVDGYEQQLPQGMVMRTDLETIRSIISVAIKRTAHRRNRKVRYSPKGLLIGSSQLSSTLKEATEHFNITLVHEGKPRMPIEVEPMRFWLPETSEKIQNLVENKENS